MSNKVLRIKSAAFIRKKYWNDNQPSPTKNIISTLPVTESRYTSKQKQQSPIKPLSLSKITFVRTNPSNTSEIWRKVHSTRSQIRLKSLNGSKVEEEPIRLNLVQKVERIRSKHSERELKYIKNCNYAQRVILQKCTGIKKQGEKGDINRKIWEVLAPLQLESKLAQQRYRGRLLRMAKH